MSVLEKFKLVELITSRTDSVATFMNGNQIKFNAATFVDLGYPEYIQLFVEEKGKQFAIKACKADAPQAIKFSKPAGEQRYPSRSAAPRSQCGAEDHAVAPEEVGMSPALSSATKSYYLLAGAGVCPSAKWMDGQKAGCSCSRCRF